MRDRLEPAPTPSALTDGPDPGHSTSLRRDVAYKSSKVPAFQRAVHRIAKLVANSSDGAPHAPHPACPLSTRDARMDRWRSAQSAPQKFENAFIIWSIPGPMTTIMSTGKIQKISGKRIFTVTF